MKKCTKCGEKKALGAFYTNNHHMDGLASLCKECHNENGRKWREANREHRKEHKKVYLLNPKAKRLYKKTIRKCNLKRLYGITLEEYKVLLKKQNNKCAICPTKYTKKKILCVDHNHKTEKVRGLLCHDCNNGIGRFKDNLRIARKAVLYLEKHEGK
jgi:hypothetical protein